VDPPERHEQEQGGIDVAGKTDDLLAAVAVSHLEQVSVSAAPDRLHHVAEVEAVREELVVAPERKPADRRRPRGRAQRDEEGTGSAERPWDDVCGSPPPRRIGRGHGHCDGG
jgi:hypothetical protein